MTKPDIRIAIPVGDALRQTMRFPARRLGGYLLSILAAWRAGRASPCNRRPPFLFRLSNGNRLDRSKDRYRRFRFSRLASIHEHSRDFRILPSGDDRESGKQAQTPCAVGVGGFPPGWELREVRASPRIMRHRALRVDTERVGDQVSPQRCHLCETST
jgi:hypothetical protein